jgi:putative transposase
MVYGFDLSLDMKKNLVINSLNQAQKTIRKLTGKKLKDKPLLHQDQGSQYTSYSYVQTALKWVRLSYSDPGIPTHNPGQESFFGRFKDEWKEEIAEIETFEELKKFVKQKIKYYNYERRHTSIGLVSPWNFTKSFLRN